MARKEDDRTVGRYEILRELGRGGMAVVHLARQLDLDRLVALKELRALGGPDPVLARRFLRESRLAGSLSHSNIVTVFDYFEVAGTPYIAMEYLEPGSLRPYVRGLTLAQAGVVFEGLLAGLRHAEEAGIVHRDLKPENVMVSREGKVKIADFGIAKATSGVSMTGFRTATGIAVGTPGYMAPEQAMARDIGPWTDLYALGCMAYEIFVGDVPFSDSEEGLALILRHLSEPIPPPRKARPDLDPEISDWIEALLRKTPAERTQSAAEAWDRFEEILIARMGPRWRRDGLLPADALAPVRIAAGPTALATPPASPYHTFVAPTPNPLGWPEAWGESGEALAAPETAPAGGEPGATPAAPDTAPAEDTPAAASNAPAASPVVTAQADGGARLAPRRRKPHRAIAAAAALVLVATLVVTLALPHGGAAHRPAPTPAPTATSSPAPIVTVAPVPPLAPLRAADRTLERRLVALSYGSSPRPAQHARALAARVPAGDVESTERAYLHAVQRTLATKRAPADLRALAAALTHTLTSPNLVPGAARLHCWASPGAHGCPRVHHARPTPRATLVPKPAATPTAAPTIAPAPTTAAPRHTAPPSHVGSTNTNSTGTTGD